MFLFLLLKKWPFNLRASVGEPRLSIQLKDLQMKTGSLSVEIHGSNTQRMHRTNYSSKINKHDPWELFLSLLIPVFLLRFAAAQMVFETLSK